MANDYLGNLISNPNRPCIIQVGYKAPSGRDCMLYHQWIALAASHLSHRILYPVCRTHEKLFMQSNSVIATPVFSFMNTFLMPLML